MRQETGYKVQITVFPDSILYKQFHGSEVQVQVRFSSLYEFLQEVQVLAVEMSSPFYFLPHESPLHSSLVY